VRGCRPGGWRDRRAEADGRCHPPADRSSDDVGLLVAGHLGGEVDVPGEVRVAGDLVRLPAHGVLEGRRRVDVLSGHLAAGRARDGVLDRQPGVVVLGRDGEQLEVRVAGLVLLPEAGELVAVGGGDRGDGPTALREDRQGTDQGRAEVRDDDVDLRVLGDGRGQHLLRLGGIPVRDLERLLTDEGVLARGVEDLVQSLGLVGPLAVAGRAAQEQDVAAVRQVLLDPLGPEHPGLLEVAADEDVVVLPCLATGSHPVGHGHHTGAVRAAQGGQDRLAGVGEDDQRVHALRHHALDVGDGLLGVALPVRVLEGGHARALADLVLGGGGGDQAPAVAAEAVGHAQDDLVGATPRRDVAVGCSATRRCPTVVAATAARREGEDSGAAQRQELGADLGSVHGSIPFSVLPDDGAVRAGHVAVRGVGDDRENRARRLPQLTV
jgi:hypothetical protein